MTIGEGLKGKIGRQAIPGRRNSMLKSGKNVL